MDLIQLGVGILLLILSIIMFENKGQLLLAGYNTKSDDEKDKYDQQKLGRVAGIYLFILSLSTFLLGIIKWRFFIVIHITIIVVGTVIFLWFINSKCKKDK